MLSDKLFHIYLIGPTFAGKTFVMRCLQNKEVRHFNEPPTTGLDLVTIDWNTKHGNARVMIHEAGGILFSEEHKIKLFGPNIRISDAIIVMISLNCGDDFCRFKYSLDAAKLFGNGCPVYVALTHYTDDFRTSKEELTKIAEERGYPVTQLDLRNYQAITSLFDKTVKSAIERYLKEKDK